MGHSFIGIWFIRFFYRQHSTHIKCPDCGKGFGDNGRLKRHKLQKHTPNHLKPYPCNICDKGFYSIVPYKDHMNMHKGIKPHKCE